MENFTVTFSSNFLWPFSVTFHFCFFLLNCWNIVFGLNFWMKFWIVENLYFYFYFYFSKSLLYYRRFPYKVWGLFTMRHLVFLNFFWRMPYVKLLMFGGQVILFFSKTKLELYDCSTSLCKFFVPRPQKTQKKWNPYPTVRWCRSVQKIWRAEVGVWKKVAWSQNM
jgi:hypothetical protein